MHYGPYVRTLRRRRKGKGSASSTTFPFRSAEFQNFWLVRRRPWTRAFPGVRIVAFGHAGDGNLHYNLSMPDSAENAQFIPRTPEANRVVHDLVAQYGGSISAEHGLGQLKREGKSRSTNRL